MAYNPQNLRDYNSLTEEEKHEWHSKGGKAGAASKRRTKTFAETLRKALAGEVDIEEEKARLQALGYDGSWMDLLSQAQLDKAARGDTEAFRAVRDTIGEKPREGLEIGNLDGQPLQTVDLRSLSDEQLRALAAARQGDEEA
jgi:hypothetical protein